jgi:hypothetical protein
LQGRLRVGFTRFIDTPRCLRSSAHSSPLCSYVMQAKVGMEVALSAFMRQTACTTWTPENQPDDGTQTKTK